LFLQSGQWVPSFSDRPIRDFQINQLYSVTVTPEQLAKSFLKAQINPADEQEFYNSKLGLTHIVEGAKVTDVHLNDCLGTYKKSSSKTGFITMGVDVGKWLHYEIDQWLLDQEGTDINLVAHCKILQEGKVLNFEDLDALMKGVSFCVVDANPERRKALEFAQRFYGRVKMCFYGNGIQGKQINIHEEEQHSITVDRTSWLDVALGRFRTKRITLPVDISQEYRSHIKSLVRVYSTDKTGNPVGKYVKGNDDDHFAHTRNYAEIALTLGAGLSKSYNIGEVL